MEIVLGVGIPALILVAIVLGYHIYKWMRNTLEGGILAATLYTALSHQTRKRKQKLNANLAETEAMLSKVKFSPEALEEMRVLETVATSTKAVRNAEEAVRIASNAYNAASTAVRNLRKSKAPGPITIEIEQAERAVTDATNAYITASKAKNRASTLLRRAQNNEDLLQEEYARQEKQRKGLHDKKEEEVVYNPEAVFLRKGSRKSNRKGNRKGSRKDNQKQTRI